MDPFGSTRFLLVDRDLTAFRVVAGAGVFGVEMFLLADGTLLLNEIAPRPHNSGHYTIEGCATSQYEQHLRAILGWPLGDTSLVVGSRCNHNLQCSCLQGTQFLNSLKVSNTTLSFVASSLLSCGKAPRVRAHHFLLS